MKTTAVIERGKDGTFGVYTPDLKSTIIGEGKTAAEAKADFENSVREIGQFYAETGEELPDELKNVEFEYRYDVASLFSLYDFINVSKFAKRIGLNPSLMRQYKSGMSYISEQQAKKIEQGLHDCATELLSVSL